jgi:circadian clock protein KaiC
VTEETLKLFGPEVEVRVQGLSALVDNIILLEYMDVGAELKRLLSVIKQRGAGHDPNVRELCITDKGIELSADPTSAHEILQGVRSQRRPRGA